MLLAQSSGLQFMVEYPVGYITDAEDQGQGYVSDWRTTMTYLLGTYYKHLVDWSHSYLSSNFSAQVGYNMPVDMVCFSTSRQGFVPLRLTVAAASSSDHRRCARGRVIVIQRRHW